MAFGNNFRLGPGFAACLPRRDAAERFLQTLAPVWSPGMGGGLCLKCSGAGAVGGVGKGRSQGSWLYQPF